MNNQRQPFSDVGNQVKSTVTEGQLKEASNLQTRASSLVTSNPLCKKLFNPNGEVQMEDVVRVFGSLDDYDETLKTYLFDVVQNLKSQCRFRMAFEIKSKILERSSLRLGRKCANMQILYQTIKEKIDLGTPKIMIANILYDSCIKQFEEDRDFGDRIAADFMKNEKIRYKESSICGKGCFAKVMSTVRSEVVKTINSKIEHHNIIFSHCLGQKI